MTLQKAFEVVNGENENVPYEYLVDSHTLKSLFVSSLDDVNFLLQEAAELDKSEQ